MLTDLVLKRKWDALAKSYDWSTFGTDRRWGPWKRDFFSRIGNGKILFLAAGTGKDFDHFPKNREIVGIDISPKMLEKASKKVRSYVGKIELKEMDVRNLTFADGYFEQVFTSCTFCSVPNPIEGLKELKRVLKPDGELWMFEHTISRLFPFRQILQLMNPLTEKIGPSVIRDTISNVELAGLKIKRVFNIYLDIYVRK